MQCGPSIWVVAAQIAIPLVLAVVGFFFTRAQVAIARSKLRLDHFDKRYAVFEAARDLLGKATIQGETKPADEISFLIGTRGATFLFEDQAVRKYVDELLRRVASLTLSQAQLRQQPIVSDRDAVQKKILADMAWVREQYDMIESVFRPHLQLNG